MNIFVSNLSYSTTSEDLQNVFAEYGEVTSSKVITDRETGRSRGFGFVEMTDDQEGKKAIAELNEAELDGKTISVDVARPKGEGSNRNNGGFGRNGGGYNRNRY